MRFKTFVPGHISCVFRPVRTDDVRTTGSLGFGLRLNLGCTATVWQSSEDGINICINGKRSEAPVTRRAIESLNPGVGLEIRLNHDLPLEQGFGASASGTYAAALCAAELLGKDRIEAAIVSHEAECSMGGGLGDLLAIESSSGVPIREEPGVPNLTGRTSDSGLGFDHLNLFVLPEPLRTESVLSDEAAVERIVRYGDEALGMFRRDPSVIGLFQSSNYFSKMAGLESDDIGSALDSIRSKGYHAGMCMLGNSIFTDAPIDVLTGLPEKGTIIPCMTYSGKISVKSF